jgi:CYTH domain-containing protein
MGGRMTTNRRFLIASSLARLIRKERGANRVTEGYFPSNPGRSSHVQVEGAACHLVLITSAAGSLPVEERTEVPRAHAEALLDVAPGKVVYDRSRFTVSGREASLDRFSLPGPLDVISLDFENENEAKSFRQPVWFGNEISGDQAFQNRSIALEGAPHAPEVPLSNAALESLLDFLENRPAYSRPRAAPAPKGRPAAVSEASSRSPAPNAAEPVIKVVEPASAAAEATSAVKDGAGASVSSVEDEVIRELARALGR